jgi:serine/threonine protein kinase
VLEDRKQDSTLMPCLSEETLSEFARGRLPPDQMPEAERHLVGCATCRRVLAETARSQTPEPPGDSWDPPTLPDVQLIGRYTLGQQIGAGGMGVVFVGNDPQLKRQVALKLVRAEVDAAWLLREAQAMAQLSHPNVVTVYDAGAYEGGVFIAMELVDGVTLRAWLDRRPKPGRRDILRVFADAGRGLEAAHARGIVHRDFKPDNVLIGHDGRVRVTDFGLARSEGVVPTRPGLAALRTPDETRTQSALAVGTPGYMAPEQFMGRPVDPRTDQFAFCVTLHEALYGERPFAATSNEALRDAILMGRLKTPPGLEGVDAALFTLLRRGLSKSPAERFVSMNALLAAIEEAQAAPLPQARAAPPRRRRWWRQGAAYLMAALCGVAVGLLAWSSLRSLLLTRAPKAAKPAVHDAPHR